MYCVVFYLVLIVNLVSIQGFLRIFNRNHQLLQDKLNTVGDPNLDTHYIEQPVDNFNKSDTRKWKNRYIKYDKYYKKDGPIILYVGGEGFIIGLYPYLVDVLAKKTNALIVLTEHRYYGATVPSKDLKYLSSKQALADMANLIIELKKDDALKHSKVVTVGGSYAGMLSTWMRAHYPHLVDAAVASSAPLLAKADFYEYMDKVSEAFEKYGTPGCADRLRNVFRSYKNAFSSDKNIQAFKEKHNICESSDMKNKYNQQHYVAGHAVYHLSSYVEDGTPAGIRYSDVCKERETLPEDIFGIKGRIDPYEHDTKNCTEIDLESEIKRNFEQDPSTRSWTYQCCTEFGYLKATSNKSIFENTVTLDFYYAICKIGFGIEKETVDDGVKATNEYYGGLTPNVTKVVFFNGGMDPWSTLGVTKSLNELAPVNVVANVSHCAELKVWVIPEPEPKELARVRDFEINTIIKWLKS